MQSNAFDARCRPSSAVDLPVTARSDIASAVLEQGELDRGLEEASPLPWASQHTDADTILHAGSRLLHVLHQIITSEETQKKNM